MTAGLPDKANDDAAGGPALCNTGVPLTEIVRRRTHALHGRAERSGIMHDILRGKANRYGYALLLRNLLPAYQCLEIGLEAHRRSPVVRAVARRELYRAAALRFDLKELVGREWESALPLLAAGEQYHQRVAIAAEGDGAGLIAHAYTRYLGDLSGGQVLKRLLARAPGLRPQELSFFEFPQIDDTEAFKRRYRSALDDSATMIADIDPVVAEVMVAFELNIGVFEAVQQASAASV
jgi:heme oxygenase (biliverdin-producing, ferredoxin)